MEEEEIIYPIIKNENEVEQMVNDKVNKDLDVERIKHMIKEEKILQIFIV